MSEILLFRTEDLTTLKLFKYYRQLIMLLSAGSSSYKTKCKYQENYTLIDIYHNPWLLITLKFFNFDHFYMTLVLFYNVVHFYRFNLCRKKTNSICVISLKYLNHFSSN